MGVWGAVGKVAKGVGKVALQSTVGVTLPGTPGGAGPGTPGGGGESAPRPAAGPVTTALGVAVFALLGAGVWFGRIEGEVTIVALAGVGLTLLLGADAGSLAKLIGTVTALAQAVAAIRSDVEGVKKGLEAGKK